MATTHALAVAVMVGATFLVACGDDNASVGGSSGAVSGPSGAAGGSSGAGGGSSGAAGGGSGGAAGGGSSGAAGGGGSGAAGGGSGGAAGGGSGGAAGGGSSGAMGGSGATGGDPTMPPSEVHYPGSSATSAFVAMDPYVIHIAGVPTTIPLGGAPRAHDFGGSTPFVNPSSGRADPSGLQFWDANLGKSVDISGDSITNAGAPGRIDKRIINGLDVTMVRYNAGDGISYEKCRSKLYSYPVPPRTHVRWELEVAFGNADGTNDWELTPSAHWGSNGSEWVIDNGGSPVLFWALTSHSQSNGPIGLDVDTDVLDATKLMVTASLRTGTATQKKVLATVHGIARHVLVPVVVEAFLDERDPSEGGKGALKIWVNDQLVVDNDEPTLAQGTKPHYWAITTYLWNEPEPYARTRATFWKMARMLVFPATP